MRLLHLEGYLIYLAFIDKDDAAARYNAGAALDAANVLGALLSDRSGNDKPFHYAWFQEWKEGIAFYTEYKIAQLASQPDYQPIPAFLDLDGSVSFSSFWKTEYRQKPFLIKHAGRASRSHLVFYHLGLGQGLVLDRLLPEWNDSYFAPAIWLDDLLRTAAGIKQTLSLLTDGTPAPAFTLSRVGGGRLSLLDFKDKVILLDFWQTWCPPCLKLLPQIKELSQRFSSRGLVVIDIIDGLPQGKAALLPDFLKQHGVDTPVLLDPDSTVAVKYGIQGYPQLFLIDGEGIIRTSMRGLPNPPESLSQQLESLLDP